MKCRHKKTENPEPVKLTNGVTYKQKYCSECNTMFLTPTKEKKK